MALDAPRGLGNDEYEAVTLNTGSEQVNIFVTKPSEAAYFDHEDVFEPLIVGTAKPDTAVDDIVEPVRKEKAASGEPADLFINALRRPAYQKFDSSTPVIRKKAVAEPAPAPIEVAPVIEQIVFREEDMAEATPVVAAEIPAEEVETVIEDVVIAEPAEENLEIPLINIPAAPAAEPDPIYMEALEVDDSRVESEMSHEAMEQATAEVLSAEKFEIGDETFDMSALAFEEAPYVAPQPRFEIEDVVYDMSCLEFEEAPYIAPAEKFEIGDETFDMSVLAVEEAPYVAEAPVEKFEIGDETFDMSCLDITEEAYGAPQPAAEKFEIGDEVFDMAFMDVEETVAAEPAMTLALPAPKKVVRSLPCKLDIEELKKAEPAAVEETSTYSGMECASTSGGAADTRHSEELTVDEVVPLPVVVVNEDRDVLMAFRSELENDEAEFISTSYDDNMAFREDYLDKTETTFKFRAKIERPRFNGDLRSLYSY